MNPEEAPVSQVPPVAPVTPTGQLPVAVPTSEIQPEISPTPEKPKSKRKIFMIIGAILTLLILGAVGIFTFSVIQKPAEDQRVVEPTNTPEATMEDETGDWNTYNGGGLFTVSIPKNWHVWSYGRGVSKSYYQINSFPENQQEDGRGSVIAFDIQDLDYTEGKSLEEKRQALEQTGKDFPDFAYSSISVQKLDGQDALVYERTIENQPSNNYSKEVWTVVGDTKYIISWGVGGKSSQEVEEIKNRDMEIFDQILSTFEFSNASAASSPVPAPKFEITEDWLKYEDNGAGFSVKYPDYYQLNDEATQKGSKASFLNCSGPYCGAGFTITLYDDYSGGSRREWLAEKFDLSTYELTYEEIGVDGVNALVVNADDSGSNGMTYVVIPGGGSQIFLLTKTSGGESNDFLNQILSTFEFTD